MTRIWTHEEARAELGAAAVFALVGDDREGVRAHVASCAECRAELAALRDAAAMLSAATPQRPVQPARSAAMRARLLERAAADVAQPARLRDPSTVRAWRSSALPWWIAAAASILLAAAGTQLRSLSRQRATLREQVASTTQRGVQLVDELRARERTIAAVSGPDVRVVELAAAGVRAPTARMFWAQATNTWTMFAYNLPSPGAGRTYQLWLVTRDGKKISAGTFAPSPAGDALVSAQYALDRDALGAIAVTDEPAGGVPQPTGSVVISGNATR
jgi:anti-sigma-K factor RskA